MVLPFRTDSLDAVDDTHRELYKPHDEGGFQLNVEGLDQHIERTNRGLVKALAAERAENKGFKALGKRPDEIVAALARATEHQESPDVKILMGQREQAWAIERAAFDQEIAAAKSSERTALTDALLATALTRAKATTEGLTLLPRQLGDRIKLDTVDGKRVLTVLDDQGQPMAGSGPDDQATVGDLVAHAKTAFPSLFEGNGLAGSGISQRGQRGTTERTITRSQFESLGPNDRAAKIRAGFKLVD
jgi:hypothetical protein